MMKRHFINSTVGKCVNKQLRVISKNKCVKYVYQRTEVMVTNFCVKLCIFIRISNPEKINKILITALF